MSDAGALGALASNLPGTDYVMNQQKIALNNAAIQRAPLALDLLRSQIANFGAEANVHQADAELKNEQLRQARFASEQLQKFAENQKAVRARAAADPLSSTSANDFTSKLDGLASLKEQALQQANLGFFISSGGAPAAGKAYIDQGIGTLAKISTIEKNAATQRAAQLAASEREIGMTAQYLGGAKSAAEFEAGKSALLAAMPDMPADERQALMQQQYSPGVVQHINDQAIAAKDKVRLAIEAAKEKSLAAERNDRINDRAIRRSTDYIEKAETARQVVKQKFTGSKTMKEPSANERANVVAELRRLKLPNVNPGTKASPGDISSDQQDQLDTAASEVLRVKENLLSTNRALTPMEAQTRAVAQVAKDLVLLPGIKPSAKTTAVKYEKFNEGQIYLFKQGRFKYLNKPDLAPTDPKKWEAIK